MQWLRTKLDGTVPFHIALWLRNTRRMKRLVADALGRPSTVATEGGEGCRVIVPVMPWDATDVPWFSIICGLLLADAGHTVTFVIDDMPFGDRPAQRRAILACIRVIMRDIATRYPVVSLRRYDVGDVKVTGVSDRVHELAELNVLRNLRGEMVTDGRAEKTVLFDRQLRLSKQAIDALLIEHTANVIVLSGGLHVTSCVWNEAARARDIRVATFDGGMNGTSLWAMDGIASHFADVPRVFERLKQQLDTKELAFVSAVAQGEIDARRTGTDKFKAQLKDASRQAGPDGDYVVVALNVPWDTQALDRHVCFSSICEFIIETVNHIITTSDIHVVVRQHPAERQKITRSSEDYRRLLFDAFGDHPQLHFFAPDDSVNTYALIERSLATIVHTSTIGNEAVLFGKPTLTGANPYYARLGVVYLASDLVAYRDLLSKILRRELVVTEAMRRNALISYYISQCNGWIVTPFNIGSFAQWSQMSFAEIADAPQQRLLVDSIVHDIPISWQNHLLRLADRGRPDAPAA